MSTEASGSSPGNWETASPSARNDMSRAIFEARGNIVTLGTFAGDDSATAILTLKVIGLSETELQEVVKPMVERIKDIGTC